MMDIQRLLPDIMLGTTTWPQRQLAQQMTDRVLRHAENKNMVGLFAEAFYSEPPEVFDWRKRNTSHLTQTYYNLVLNTVKKIERADDFVVTWPQPPSGLGEGDALEAYCTQQYPQSDSVFTWFSENGWKALLNEPNGVEAVMPMSFGMIHELVEIERARRLAAMRGDIDAQIAVEEARERLTSDRRPTPFLQIFITDDVVWCDPSELIVISVKREGAEKALYSDYLVFTPGQVNFYFRDDNSNAWHGVPIWVQPLTGTEQQIASAQLYMIARPIGGEPMGYRPDDPYRSFIDGCVNPWNDAMVMHSNITASMTQAVFEEKWQYKIACGECHGDGKVWGSDKKFTSTCTVCGGNGYQKTGPFSTHIIRPQKDNEHPVPIPPAGYIKKDLEATNLLIEQRDKNLVAGLAAINFEYLAASPLNQSGVAKELDRQEINAFLYQIADYAINRLMVWGIRMLSLVRYGADPNIGRYWDEMAPTITVPRRFDIFNATAYSAEMKEAKAAGQSIEVIRELEMRYIRKAFETEPQTASLLMAITRHNPMYGRTPDEWLALSASNLLSKEDMVLAANIYLFCQEASESDAKFLSGSFKTQREKLMDMVDEWMDENETAFADPVSLKETDSELQSS